MEEECQEIVCRQQTKFKSHRMTKANNIKRRGWMCGEDTKKWKSSESRRIAILEPSTLPNKENVENCVNYRTISLMRHAFTNFSESDKW